MTRIKEAQFVECIQLLISCFGVMTPAQLSEAKKDWLEGKERREREQRNAARRTKRKFSLQSRRKTREELQQTARMGGRNV